MAVDLAVVFSPVGGGHKAAALATAEAARARGLTVEVIDAFEHWPKLFGGAYLGTHLTGQAYAPNVYGAGYFAANRRGGAWEPVRHSFDRIAMASLERAVVALAPRAVVATHHLPLVVLGRSRETGRLEADLTAVVTDYTAHACWAERGVDRFCVPNALAFEEIVMHGADPWAVHLTGIPVRGAFEALPAARDPRIGERLRVLVTSGGFGVGPMRSIVRSFRGVPGVDLTVVCGRAESLVEQVREDVAALGISAEVVGYERDMPARVAEAHVVVGKAGGLTVSETLASGRPMVVVGAVPGNEKLNERFVVQNGAGVAVEPGEVGRTVAQMRARGLVRAMGRRARQLVMSRAAETVVRVALGEVAAGGRPSLAA
jgi:processive 1,2-diacylglycerol beta-glucosyltransferase